jgi:fibronectin-binding autotransporter adhesin
LSIKNYRRKLPGLLCALRLTSTLAAGFVLQWAGEVRATTRAWNDGSGNWSTAADWTPSGVPAAGDTVNINETDGVSRTITYDYTGAAVTLSSLAIDLTGYTGTATTLFSMSANNLSATNEFVGSSGLGSNGTGLFNQSGGTNTVSSGQLFIGVNSTDKGFYYLSGTGSLTATGEDVGYMGTGTFNQSGGSNSVNPGSALNVGELSNSIGVYTLSGSGTLSVSGYEYIGDAGSGTFNQSGGTNTINSGYTLYVGYNSVSNGTYNLSGTGTLSVTGFETVGVAGTGTFNQTGGTNTLNGTSNLNLGYNSGSSGTYTLGVGGYLSVGGNVYVGGSSTGAGGKGVLTVSGGDLDFPGNGTLTVYNTAGSALTLSNNGSITAGSLNLSGNLNLFNWTSGSLDLGSESVIVDNSAAANLGDSGSAAGTLTLAASQTLTVSGSETIGYTSTGTITQAGINAAGTDVYIGYNTGSIGTLTLSGAATLTVGGNLYVGGSLFGPGGKGTLTVGGLSSVTVSNTGALTVYNTTGSSLTLSGGTISTGSLNLSGNLALFNWTSGTLDLTNPNFNAIFDTAANGGNLASSLALSASKSLMVAGSEIIGNSGTVSATQSGGSNTLNGSDSILYIGYNSGSSGSYSLSGSGVLSIIGSSIGGEVVGYNGAGIFNQTGGTNIVGSANSIGQLLVNALPSSTGTYTFSGGAIAVAGVEVIGVYGTGTFTQTGGTNTITMTSNEYGELDLGYYPGGSGTYTLTGGSLLASGDVTVGGESAQDTGSVSTPFGTGVLSVSNGATMTVGGTLTIFNTSGSSVTLNGATINAAQLDFNGMPSLFNWTSGTLNITSDVTWDSAAATTSTSDAFLSALTLGTGQTLMVTGNETIGGIGAFTLTLNSGSTHYVTESITLNPTGILTQNAGSALYFSSFTQAGGTINGTFQNQGEFIYQSGLFNARLLNQGTVSLGPAFTAANGIENDASIYISTGQTVTINGQGLDNLGTFSLNGGTINGAGSLLNDFGGTFYAAGTITQAFSNEGLLVIDGITRFNGGATNVGSVTGGGTIIGVFTNSAGGTVSVESGESLSINTAWNNAGLITPQPGGTLGGAAVTNTGTIEGTGAINASVLNTTGVIRASGGELDLKGTGNTNASGAQIQSDTGSTVMYTQGLATNAGTIALSGGAFDNNNQSLSNTGTISGNGILRTGGLTNAAAGLILLTDTASSVYGAITNNGHIHIVNNTTTFYGNVNNTSGTIEVTGSTARFLGNGVSMTVGGTYISDPSSNYFNGLAIITGGLVSGGVGDAYYITGNSAFTNAGTFTNAGSLSASTINNTGQFTETGALTETGNFTNSGTVVIGGPQTWSAGTSFTNTAGSATFNTDSGSAASSPLAVAATGGSITYHANQHLASLAITGSGKVDLVGNELFISSTPAATIRSYIAEAYDNGKWDLPGLTSSLAAANVHGSTAVGYTISAGQVLVKYTWYGDANLDGIVNSADLAMISSTGTTWSSGDFNYDGVVNSDDYSLFMLGSANGGSANISTTLPEPASALLLLTTPLLLRRKSCS